MKKGRKILTALLIILSLLAISSVSVLASEGDTVDGGENIFESAYALILENADGIFSALAFGGTLLLTLFYKRGLTPYVSKSLSSLSDSVAKMREISEESAEKYGADTEKITERLGTLENSLDLFASEIGALEEKLGTEAHYLSDREVFRTVLTSQIDMLYDVFLSSSLPEYQKDAIRERVKSMKEALRENETA